MRIIMLPFQMLWSLISFLLALTGRLVLGIVGLALIIAGLALSITVIGAFIGVPFVILGILLLARSFF